MVLLPVSGTFVPRPFAAASPSGVVRPLPAAVGTKALRVAPQVPGTAEPLLYPPARGRACTARLQAAPLLGFPVSHMRWGVVYNRDVAETSAWRPQLGRSLTGRFLWVGSGLPV